MPIGTNLPGTTARERAIRQVVYQGSKLNAVGLQVIPEQMYGTLDVQFDYPGHVQAEYPLADTDVAGRRNIIWAKFNKTLLKGQARFFQSDAASIRRIAQATNKLNVQRASEGMAVQKDKEILAALVAGVPSGQTNAATGGTGWGGVNADPENDIVTAWNYLVDNSNMQVAVKESGLNTADRVFVVVPTSKWGNLNKLQLINNVQQSLMSYMTGSFQLEFYASRAPFTTEDKKGATWPLATTALVGVAGEMTAIHGVYDGSEESVPLVEETRVPGAGYDYLVSQWFATGIIEDGISGAGKTARLASITGL